MCFKRKLYSPNFFMQSLIDLDVDHPPRIPNLYLYDYINKIITITNHIKAT